MSEIKVTETFGLKCSKVCDRLFCIQHGCLQAKSIEEINTISALNEFAKLGSRLKDSTVANSIRKLDRHLKNKDTEDLERLEKIRKFELNPFNGKTGEYKYPQK